MSKIEIPDNVNRKTITEYQIWTLVDVVRGKDIACAFYESKFDEYYPDMYMGERYAVQNREWVTEAQLNNPAWRSAFNFLL